MKMDYAGKVVYLGIDVHKKKYVIAARCEGDLVKTWTQDANAKQLAESVSKWFSGAHVEAVYEAGFSGFGLYRYLKRHGIHTLVVNPASVEGAINDRVKTDKRDAKKMAELLEAKRLQGIYVPTLEEELARQYQRTRSQLMKARVRAGNQFKSKLFQFGYLGSEDDAVANKKFLQSVMEEDLPDELRLCLQTLYDQWLSLDSSIKALEGKIREQAASEQRQVQIIKSTIGVGDISAVIISTELLDFKRFRNQKTIFRITGLTPSEHSSGESVRRGKISRQGNSRLRWVLTEVAWRAIKKDEALRESFDRIAARRGKKRAIVAIARKIIGRIRACIWNDVDYAQGTYA